MKIYLSGEITGKESEPKKHFNSVEKKLRDEIFSYNLEVVNPFNLKHRKDSTWSDYLKTDIKELVTCDCIYMLKGWENSKRARLEFHIAAELGIEIRFEL